MWTLTNSARLIDKIKNIKTTWVETTQPSNPVTGSMYYDQNDWTMKVYDWTEWKELWWWGWWGWWFICTTYDNPALWPSGASYALVSEIDNSGNYYSVWWPIQFARDDVSTKRTCVCSIYFQSTNNWWCISSSWCWWKYQTTFFASANQWSWKVGFVDVLAVWGWANSNWSQWWSWWWICEMCKMPIYQQWEMFVSVWSAGNSSSFWSVRVWWWSINCSWSPLDKSRWTSCTLRKSEWCYSITNYWWAWWNTQWWNANCNRTCFWCAWYNSDKCDLVVNWATPWWWHTSCITWQERTYWWWWWNGYGRCDCFYPWNYWWASDKVLVLPSCWAWAWWNWAWLDQYIFRVNWYNWCSSCTMPNCCFTYTDEWNHCCHATYYWWWWGWWGWCWCQWIVIVRYPTDGSYWLSNDTLWWDITTAIIWWKEWRIHTFTDTSHTCCFYPVFK